MGTTLLRIVCLALLVPAPLGGSGSAAAAVGAPSATPRFGVRAMSVLRWGGGRSGTSMQSRLKAESDLGASCYRRSLIFLFGLLDWNGDKRLGRAARFLRREPRDPAVVVVIGVRRGRRQVILVVVVPLPPFLQPQPLYQRLSRPALWLGWGAAQAGARVDGGGRRRVLGPDVVVAEQRRGRR
eukprot:CAMPEP_0184101104 /NCGR_PEP_ID=MMETSP0974-20121125/12665_1 /TAXON_ID=483370 /ORGANISM="non described non described, Strain CCMP2097" /LENGTH=182 /DNA_ID=CAMNT_0026404031 /DNA_START=86 /DNA_END=630 /DNA_ORIENTATION=+